MDSITYKIRHIASEKDKDYVCLLNLYTVNIEPSIRTNSNEITYWLNRYNKKSKINSFWILALYINDKPIGYCQTAYFKASKILFIDYCVIEEGFRGRAFNEFIYLIKDFYKEQNIEIYYFVAEVPFYSNNNIPSNKSISLTRLLKISGFKVVKALYYQPELGLANHESEMRASLIIFVNGGGLEKQSLKTNTYFDILKTIYFDHYEYWYIPFMSEYEKTCYHKKLLFLFDKVKEELKNKNILILNGEAYSLEQTNSSVPKKTNRKIIFLMILVPVIILILLCGISIFLEKQLGFEREFLPNILVPTGIISIAVIIIWTIWDKDIKSIFVDFVKNKIG
jgi:hypothetical protein